MSPILPVKTIWIITATLVFCAIGVVIGLSLPANHDEFQYIAAAHLYGKLDIYREYFHSQPPYFPIALHYWNSQVSDPIGSVYIASRLFNVFWSLLFVCSMIYVLVLISPSAILSVGVFAIVYFSEILDLPLRVARNDMMPLALTSSALALLSRCHFQAECKYVHRRASYFLAGVLLAAAVSSKHSYAVVALSVTLTSLISPEESIRDRWKQMTLPLIVGGVVGACPLLYFAVKNWTTMRFSLFEFHRMGNLQWDPSHAPETNVFILDRAVRLVQELYNISNVAALFVFALFIIATIAQGGRIRTSALSHWRMLSLSVLTIALILPTLLLYEQLHPQYLAPLIPFVGISIVSAAGIFDNSVDRLAGKQLSHRAIFATVSAFLIVVALSDGLVNSNKGAVAHLRSMIFFKPTVDNPVTFHRRNFPEVWAAEHYTRVAHRMVDILGAGYPKLRIATLMTAYPIEAGYEIYPEFAGAPFFYRSNDRLSAAERLKYVGVSPLTVRNWLKEKNAEALLVGYSAEIEAGFWDYAREHRFACFRINLSGAYNFHADGSREAYLLALPARTAAAPDCEVDMVTHSGGSDRDR